MNDNEYLNHVGINCTANAASYYRKAKNWTIAYWMFVGSGICIGAFLAIVNLVLKTNNFPDAYITVCNEISSILVMANTAISGFLKPGQKAANAEAAGDEYSILYEKTLVGEHDRKVIHDQYTELTKKYNSF
jgi:hypothetical protein